MAEITISNEQKVSVTLHPQTDSGKAVALDGPPTWSVQSGHSIVERAADGLSATLISADDPGDTIFLIEADADLGAGVTTLAETIKLTVLGAQAKNLGVSFGAPELK